MVKCQGKDTADECPTLLSKPEKIYFRLAQEEFRKHRYKTLL